MQNIFKVPNSIPSVIATAYNRIPNKDLSAEIGYLLIAE
jgi:hypothetical protein